MNTPSQQTHSSIESRVAEKYRQEGFEVILEPQERELPFDLGTYRPDLIVRKSKDEGYIVEVRNTAARIPVERYQEIAELIAQHAGWRFLLITGDDAVTEVPEKIEGEFPSWQHLKERLEQVNRLLSLGESEGAFLSLWVLLEALMRKRAEQMALPIERLPTSSLVNHLYSQGELSMAHYERVRVLQETRNRLVHGIEVSQLDAPLAQLQEVVNELMVSWTPG